MNLKILKNVFYYCFKTLRFSLKTQRRLFWQGRQGSNLRPSVLETDALPTELLPYQDVKPKKKQITSSLCAKCVFDPTCSICEPPDALFSIFYSGKLYNSVAYIQCIPGESCLS